MNLSQLKTRVRELTGVYAVDVLSNSLLTAWLNEAYQEIDRARDWDAATSPWNYTALDDNDDYPAFNAQFHPLLAYRVAIKVLAMEGDTSPRTNLYASEYESLFADMVVFYFPAAAQGTSSTLTGLREYVRFLAGAFGRELPNAMLTAVVNEAYLDIAGMQEWSWAGPVTALGGDVPNTLIPDPHKPVVAYLAAARLMSGVEGMDGKVQEYRSRVEQYLQDMVLSDRRDSATGTVTTRDDIVRYVRDLLGTYNTEYSDALLASMVVDAYTEVGNYRPWPWLESSVTVVSTAGDDSVSLTNGCRRVLDVYFVPDNSEKVEPFGPAPHLLDVEENSARFVYDVNFDGLLEWAPPLDENGTLFIRYVRKNLELPSGSSTPLFDVRFRPMLGLRVAARVAAMRGDDKAASAFLDEYQSILEQMVSEYLLDHDSRPIQLGGYGLETRKYLPWFRTA